VQDSATYGYLANSSLLSSVTFGSGAATNYSYEPHRNLKTQVANRHNSTLISQYDYTYDAISRRTSMTTTGNLFSDTTATTTATHETDLAQPGQINYISNALNQYTGIDRDGSISSPVYDDDGNMTDDGTRIFTWNGENRLVSAAPKTPVEGDKKAEFVYDYMGRRVKKSLYSYSAASSWQLEKEILFIWDGWNLIRESTVASGVQSIRDFVWGLDLSQSLQGAGGVGGLLAMVDQGNEYLYFYDANGNVGQLLNSSGGAVAAHYEYDPYGNLTRSYGEYVSENPFRFSTKYKDDETGLYYYGYRDYDPEMGRWLSRDPIGERKEINLYGFVKNNGINELDYLGLSSVDLGPKIKDFLISQASVGFDGSRLIANPFIAPLGAFLQIHFFGTLLAKPCCDRKEGDMDIMWEAKGGLEAFLQWGGAFEWKTSNHGKLEPNKGYRDRSWHADFNEQPAICPDGIFEFQWTDWSIVAFIRGTLGAGIGVQGSLEYTVAQYNFDPDSLLDRLHGSGSIAWGVLGGSLELGINGSLGAKGKVELP